MTGNRTTMLMDAFDDIDPELLYNARTSLSVKHRMVRIGAAIAACTVLIAGIAIYSIFLRTAATVTIDCVQGATLSLNAAGYVTAVSPDTQDLNEAKGKPVKEAVHTVIGAMVSRRALTHAQNTVILGCSRATDTQTILSDINEALKGYELDGAVMAVCTAGDSRKPSSLTDGKHTILCAVSAADEHLRYDNIRRLSPTALALLMDAAKVSPDGVIRTGIPSREMLIGDDCALAFALSEGSLHEPQYSTALTCCNGELCYLVTLKSGDRGEAFLIEATTGAVRKTVRSGADQIDSAAEKAIIPSAVADEPAALADSDAATAAPEASSYNSNSENKTISTDPPTESPQRTERLPYTTTAITMKELSFVTLSLPNDAHEVRFDTLFEGQYLDDGAVGTNTGHVALIDSYGKWLGFLDDHPGAYWDTDGNTPDLSLDERWFETHALIAADFTFKSASYYTALTALYATGDTLYAEQSLDYGQAKGAGACCALSLYSIARSELPDNPTLTIY